jgi:hypothetical protein
MEKLGSKTCAQRKVAVPCKVDDNIGGHPWVAQYAQRTYCYCLTAFFELGFRLRPALVRASFVRPSTPPLSHNVLRHF